MQKQNDEFDFNKAVSNISELDKQKNAAAKKKKNETVAIVGLGVVTAVAAAGGITYTISAKHEKIDQTITSAKQKNTPLTEGIEWLQQQESAMRVEKNAIEQLMNAAIAQKQTAIGIINAEKEVAGLYNLLNMAHVKDAKDIQKMIDDLKKIQSVIEMDDYSKKGDLIDSESFKTWSKVSEMKKNGEMKFANIEEVKEKYETFMAEVVTFEKQYVKVIKEVLESGKYSLNQSQAEIMSGIQKEANASRTEFVDLQKEIKESSDALRQEGMSTDGMENAFGDKELVEAESAISDMENAALQKALEDKRTVEAMINSINNGESVESALGMTGQNPTVPAAGTTTPAPTTTTTHSSGSSMMPFLMGMWLGNAFGSSPSYNSFSNSSAPAAQKDRASGGYAGAAFSGGSNSSRFGNAMNNTKASSAYSFNNKDSYINKVASNSSRAGSSAVNNIAAAKTKLNSAKMTATRATALKNAAFSKAGISAGTKASQARMAISQSRASSVSRGGFSGGRGGSSGG